MLAPRDENATAAVSDDEVAGASARCPTCGHAPRQRDASLTCSMCGALWRRERIAAGGDTPERAVRWRPGLEAERRLAAAELEPRPCSRRHDPDAPWHGVPMPVLVLALGAVLAPMFALTPGLRLAGWFLASLVHEIGHTAVALATGCPAFPAISLAGHAATVHQEQQPAIAVAILTALAVLAWKSRGRRRAIAAVLAAVYPFLAFTSLRELLHLAGGHLGELAFATLFFVRAWNGGFTHSFAERAAHALYGWHLLGGTTLLCTGLLFDPAARAAYGDNGSFGLTNDMIRIAEDVVGCSLQAVAFVMLLFALAVPAAVWLTLRASRAGE